MLGFRAFCGGDRLIGNSYSKARTFGIPPSPPKKKTAVDAFQFVLSSMNWEYPIFRTVLLMCRHIYIPTGRYDSSLPVIVARGPYRSEVQPQARADYLAVAVAAELVGDGGREFETAR